MRYCDFDLKLSGDSRGGYFVEVLASPVEVRTEPLSFRLPEGGLAEWLDGLRRAEYGRESVRALGRSLFDILFPPRIRSIFDVSRGHVKDENILRLRLDVRLPELATIPWEVIHDGHSHLALGRRCSISRYLYDRPAIPPIEGISAPGILLASSMPSDVPALPAIEQEIAHINESVSDLLALEKVSRLDILRQTTLQKLQRQLRQHSYQVLHYMGHGMFKGEEGFLALEDERGGARWVDAETLSCFFRDTPLRLLVLNACHTAVGSPKNQLLGVAQAALAAGVPAVVAMQSVVKDELALAFAREFYLSLAEGHALERCMAEGRKAIVDRASLDRFDWAIPVLFSNAEDGIVWRLTATEEESEIKPDDERHDRMIAGDCINIDRGSQVGNIIQAKGDGATAAGTINNYYESSPGDKKRKADK